jgi:hypothetical protein
MKPAPLLGHNLVRLLYLDEAGTDLKAPNMCVGGVMVHGDREWPEIDSQIAALIEKHVAPDHQDGFIFHATDIYHGSRYFDRRKPEWEDQAKRHAILDELAAIIEKLMLPVVFGSYDKSKFGTPSTFIASLTAKAKGTAMQGAAVMDCLMFGDAWLAKYAPNELATVVHEDGTPAKQLIKYSVRVLRSETLMEKDGLGSLRKTFDLPLKRIIDTVHFADKPGARPLQLADLCAFIIARWQKGLHVPDAALQIILKHAYWAVELRKERKAKAIPSSSTEQAQ